MRFRLAGLRLSSCNNFPPNQLAVGCKAMLFCRSPAFIWPSRSSAVLFLQHQKSQQTWAELPLETCARNHTISKEHKEIGEAVTFFPSTEIDPFLKQKDFSVLHLVELKRNVQTLKVLAALPLEWKICHCHYTQIRIFWSLLLLWHLGFDHVISYIL